MDVSRKPYTFDRVVRIVFSIIGILAALWIINYLKGVLLPFLVACLMAYMLDPVVEWNKRLLHLKGRTLATILTLVEVTVVVGVLLYFFIPYVYSEMQSMIGMLKSYTQAQLNIPYLPAEVHDFIKKYIDINYLSSLLTREQWMKLLSEAANQTWTFVGGTLSVIFTICSWFIVLMYVVFILIDYDKITTGFRRAIPTKYRKTTLRIFNDIQVSMNRYFRGQALVSFIVGVLFSIGFSIVGIPMAVILGMFIGVLNMVPYLQLISIPIAALLCLVSSVTTGHHFWEVFGWVFLVYCVVQVIQDLFLTPKIMGKAMGLNPAIIFLSLSIWGCLLGFIGLIVALPLTTLLLAYYDEFVINRDEERYSTKHQKYNKTTDDSEKE